MPMFYMHRTHISMIRTYPGAGIGMDLFRDLP